jgi:hypothetical protein
MIQWLVESSTYVKQINRRFFPMGCPGPFPAPVFLQKNDKSFHKVLHPYGMVFVRCVVVPVGAARSADPTA